MGINEVASSESSSVSSTLLDQLRARRPEAWERFVRLYSPTIYRWCRQAGLTAEDAADVFQEVLSAVMLHLPDFHRNQSQDSFSGWLATITRNKVRDHYRRRQGRAEARGGSTAQRQMAEIPQPPEREKGTGPICRNGPDQPFRSVPGAAHKLDLSPFPVSESIRPDDESTAWLLKRVLEMIRVEFEVSTWEAFRRTAIDGQPPACVAEDLHMSVPAVYMAKSRVLRRLRRAMGELPQ